MNKPVYYAHSGNSFKEWHELNDHLKSVSDLAFDLAGRAPWRDEAALAGILHDLGKYADRFQARLRGQDSGLDHWSQGAWLGLTLFPRQPALAAALAIEGHHIGLQQGSKDSFRRLLPNVLAQGTPLGLALSDTDHDRLLGRARSDGLDFRKPDAFALSSWERSVAAMLDVRLLFSCLVDADFLNTETHFKVEGRPEGMPLDSAAALSALESMRNNVRTDSRADANVREARETLWQATLLAAQSPPGLFTLTAPTGSGKTLAMLKFALEHVAKNPHLRRIVLAVPFLTVIEQTARVYRTVFAGFQEHFVLEHHSLAGVGKERSATDSEGEVELQRRLLTENWDAPIVLTTNVQLLESLFSNRPSACRKLHNLMDSVILFDEAQSLPQHLAVPTLAALSHLSAAYNSTVVFATATQPAFDALHEAVAKHAVRGWKPVEAVPGNPALFGVLKRVKVHWPVGGEKLGWEKLAEELRGTDQALVVVNLKRHALALLEKLEGAEGVFHLSTNMCAEHRRAVLDEVRARLDEGKICLLISTQCIEAGVDVDFPRVWRAMAPLEAIAQAAGRCNREGRMKELGEMVVFEPDVEGDWRRRYPTHAYYQAAQVTLTMLKAKGNFDINDPGIFRDYYRLLYDLNNPASQSQELNDAITALNFAEVAKCYRLIDQDAIQVLAPWADRWSDFESLRVEADRDGISADWMCRAQGLGVSIYRPKPGHPAWSVLIPAKLRCRGNKAQGRPPVSDEWFIIGDPHGGCYDEVLGLRLPESDQVFIA